MTVDHCSSCGAPIIWATLTRADGQTSTHPLDWLPTRDGNIAAHRHPATGLLQARTLTAGQKPELGELRAVSHFATCPTADQHRKR